MELTEKHRELNEALEVLDLMEQSLRAQRKKIEDLAIDLALTDWSHAGHRVTVRPRWKSGLSDDELLDLWRQGHTCVRVRPDLSRQALSDCLGAGGDIAESVRQELRLEQTDVLSIERETRKGRA